jgi:hypothetical protein
MRAVNNIMVNKGYKNPLDWLMAVKDLNLF